MLFEKHLTRSRATEWITEEKKIHTENMTWSQVTQITIHLWLFNTYTCVQNWIQLDTLFGVNAFVYAMRLNILFFFSSNIWLQHIYIKLCIRKTIFFERKINQVISVDEWSSNLLHKKDGFLNLLHVISSKLMKRWSVAFII